MHSKILSFDGISSVLDQERAQGKKIVHCHGVFDLLHPGHIRHFKEAKSQGDCLVVTVTPDRYVNKGPDRPFFNENLRTETIAALGDVDYVILNDSPDAIDCIKRVRPDIYVKGKEYKDHEKDVTGKISHEAEAIEKLNGMIYYTDDIVFSSSSLLNRYFDPLPPGVQNFLRTLKEGYTVDDILQKLENLRDLNVLIVGDAIIDEYQYVSPLGQSAKGLHMSAELMEKEVFLGGSLIIANHIAQFSDNVTLLTSTGKECSHQEFIDNTLDRKVNASFFPSKKKSTLTKKRYVMKDGKNLSKLFETYSTNDLLLNDKDTDEIIDYLEKNAKNFDLVLVCDFGDGFINAKMSSCLSRLSCFLAVNTQTNSGNRGFNVVTHYEKANFISLNEPEIRLAAHDRYSSLESIVKQITSRMNHPSVCITRGVNGVLCYDEKGISNEIPALTTNAIDRVGAGDSFFSLASLCAVKGYPLILSGFIGSLAAAIDVQVIGNKMPVIKQSLCKYLVRIMK